MTLDARLFLALVFFVIGVFVNILAARRMVRSKKVIRIGFAATFIGLGLFVPFYWWEKVGLSPWSGVLSFLVIGTALSFLIDVWRDTDKSRRKKQRS